jgi:hypothetical protein
MMNFQNPAQINSTNSLVEVVYQHLVSKIKAQHSRVDEVLLNSFMDLCVKFDLPSHALEIHSLFKKYSKTQSSTGEDINESIRVGILIKAYGLKGMLDSAFAVFSEHMK